MALARRREASAPAVDPFGYDPATHDMVRPLLRFLYERYWRVEIQGIENIPRRGPALIVANHSGAIPFDAAMIAAASELDGHGRLVRFLYDRFVEQMPLVGALYNRVGSVPATYENASKLLARGDLVGVFPEGVDGIAKGFRRRYRLQRFRSGFVRLALEHKAVIVPVAVVGAEETYPVVGKLEALGRLRELLGVPYVPLTPLFPLLGPLGAIPLPSRWHIRFGEPISLFEDLGRLAIRRRTVHLLAQRVRRQVQGMLHEILAERDTLF